MGRREPEHAERLLLVGTSAVPSRHRSDGKWPVWCARYDGDSGPVVRPDGLRGPYAEPRIPLHEETLLTRLLDDLSDRRVTLRPLL